MMAALAAAPPAGLLMIDLDGFKKTNDTLGHGAGDELLIAVSRRFETALPAGATLYRLGGDEFAVLFDGTFDAARSLAADLLTCLNDPIELSTAYERARASIGVAHRVLAGHADHVLDDLDAVFQGGVRAPFHEGRIGGHPNESAPLGDELELLVGLVAGMVVQAAGTAVGVGHRHA